MSDNTALIVLAIAGVLLLSNRQRVIAQNNLYQKNMVVDMWSRLIGTAAYSFGSVAGGRPTSSIDTLNYSDVYYDDF